MRPIILGIWLRELIFGVLGGTPHAQALLPLLAEFQVPLVGPSTGAMALHDPVQPWVFNVRATYQREAAWILPINPSLEWTTRL